VAFLSAGLIVSLGRQMRHYVRPYFLPSSSTPPSAPNSLPKYPYPNTQKRLYDVLGWLVVQSNLNYIVCAFFLLNLKDCVRAYHRMGWYSHILIAGAMAFFHFGGRRMLRAGLPAAAGDKGDKARTAKIETDTSRLGPTPTWKVHPPSPIDPPPQPKDEVDPTDLKWVRHALEGKQQKGQEAEGVGGDAGFVDSVMRGTETPGLGSPRYSRSGSPSI
jgi:lysophospholipid acyltransferase